MSKCILSSEVRWWQIESMVVVQPPLILHASISATKWENNAGQYQRKENHKHTLYEPVWPAENSRPKPLFSSGWLFRLLKWCDVMMWSHKKHISMFIRSLDPIGTCLVPHNVCEMLDYRLLLLQLHIKNTLLDVYCIFREKILTNDTGIKCCIVSLKCSRSI